jgi:hypothetical protein
MTILSDSCKLYRQVTNHDFMVEQCGFFADHYNFLAGLEINDDVQRQQFEAEMSDYLIYDC